jgi:hypothetical protein
VAVSGKWAHAEFSSKLQGTLTIGPIVGSAGRA